MRMVIVGAGESGARAALALRSFGHDGEIVLIGAEPDLPYERPPLSKQALSGDVLPTGIADEAALAAARIDFRCGAEVTAIDRAAGEVVCADGSRIGYDRLLLATGARPRELPNATGVHYLRNHADCRALRAKLTPGAKVVVIGGGFLGLEIAAAARQRGADVTVLETQPRLMARGVPQPIAEVIAEQHRQAGVDIRCGVGIAEIAADGVTLGSGEKVAADLVAAAVGAMPKTALAEAAGLAVDNGVRVNASLRTSDPNIFAAGDCVSFPLPVLDGKHVRLESWRSAGEHAAIAAQNMLGGAEVVTAVPWFWSDQYDLSLQVAGLPDPSHTVVRRDLDDSAFVLFHLAPDGRLMAASGVGPEGRVARDIKLAEMLIAARAHPDPARLAEPSVKLKSLLAA